MRRWPWKKHERWAGKGPAEGLEWSERVGWGAGEDLGRTHECNLASFVAEV